MACHLNFVFTTAGSTHGQLLVEVDTSCKPFLIGGFLGKTKNHQSSSSVHLLNVKVFADDTKTCEENQLISMASLFILHPNRQLPTSSPKTLMKMIDSPPSVAK